MAHAYNLDGTNGIIERIGTYHIRYDGDRIEWMGSRRGDRIDRIGTWRARYEGDRIERIGTFRVFYQGEPSSTREPRSDTGCCVLL